MKCIILNFPKGYGRYLSSLFYKIYIQDYVWDIGWDDVMFTNHENIYVEDNYFEKVQVDGIIAGKDFKQIIDRNDCYLIFLYISAFKNSTEVIPIDTFNDFLDSSCEISFFISDSTYVEIYCKDELVANQLIDNCYKHNFNILEVTQDKNHMYDLFKLH